jgi:hypothetical protein
MNALVVPLSFVSVHSNRAGRMTRRKALKVKSRV